MEERGHIGQFTIGSRIYHNPVIVKLLIKLKRYTKKESSVRFNVAELKDAKSSDHYLQLLDSDSPTLDTVDKAWEGLRDSIRNAAEKTVRFSKHKVNPWISEQAIALISKRDHTRNQATKSKLRKENKKSVRADKNNYYNNMAEYHILTRQENTRKVYSTNKQLTGKGQRQNETLKDEKGVFYS